MLSVGRIYNRDYLVNLAKEDYYLSDGLSGGEPPGKWHGQGAESLGLQHLVNKADLHQLMDGYHPFDRGHKLVQNAGKTTREIGWDFTFSAPKTVSTIWSQADPKTRKAIEAIQESAVRKIIDFLEERAISRTGKNGRTRVPSSLVTASFEHGTSRALDPNLHSHVVLLNIGIRQDGKTGALDISRLLDLKLIAGTLFRAELAAQLSEKLGYEIGAHLGGKPDLWDVQGVSPELVTTFSKRRKQIEESLKTKGLTSAVAASVAALDTRREKKDVNRQELFAVWKEIGQGIGYVPPPPKFINRDREKAKRKLGALAVNALLEKGMSFTEDELMRLIAERAPKMRLGIDDIKHATRDALNRDGLIRLDDNHRYTTIDIHRKAKAVIEAMEWDAVVKQPYMASQQTSEQQLSLRL